MGNIFVVGACTADKVGKVALFVGKIFMVRPPTTKTTAPQKLHAIQYNYE